MKIVNEKTVYRGRPISFIFFFIFLALPLRAFSGPMDSAIEQAKNFADTQKPGDKGSYGSYLETYIQNTPHYKQENLDEALTRGSEYQSDPKIFTEDVTNTSTKESQFLNKSFLDRPRSDPCRNSGPDGEFACNDTLKVSVDIVDEQCFVYDNTTFKSKKNCNKYLNVNVSNRNVTCNIKTNVTVSSYQYTARVWCLEHWTCGVAALCDGHNYSCNRLSTGWMCGRGYQNDCHYNESRTGYRESESISNGCSSYQSNSKYTLASSTCTDSGWKTINGKKVYRSCWNTRRTYKYKVEGSSSYNDQCSSYENNSQYTLISPPECVSSGCRTINSLQVCKDCWEWESEYGIRNDSVDNQCVAFEDDSNYSLVSSQCTDSDCRTVDDQKVCKDCWITENNYQSVTIRDAWDKSSCA